MEVWISNRGSLFHTHNRNSYADFKVVMGNMYNYSKAKISRLSQLLSPLYFYSKLTTNMSNAFKSRKNCDKLLLSLYWTSI